jgi:hypothetical protein
MTELVSLDGGEQVLSFADCSISLLLPWRFLGLFPLIVEWVTRGHQTVSG